MTIHRRPTQHTDNNGSIIPHTSTDDIMNVSKFGTDNIVIIGYAVPGSLDSEPRWKIIFYTYDSASNPVKTRIANGINDYSHIWESASIATGVAITGATKASPCVLTSVGHTLSTGDFIEIDSMATGGMVELNSDGYGSNVYHVTKLTADTVSLQKASSSTTNIDSSTYGAYTTGGKFYKKEVLNYIYS